MFVVAIVVYLSVNTAVSAIDSQKRTRRSRRNGRIHSDESSNDGKNRRGTRRSSSTDSRLPVALAKGTARVRPPKGHVKSRLGFLLCRIACFPNDTANLLLTVPSQFFLKAYFSFIFGGAIALQFFIFASAAEFQIFIIDCAVFIFGFRLFSSFEYSLEGVNQLFAVGFDHCLFDAFGID